MNQFLKSKTFLNILIVVLLAIILVCTTLVILKVIESSQSKATYDKVAEEVVTSGDEITNPNGDKEPARVEVPIALPVTTEEPEETMAPVTLPPATVEPFDTATATAGVSPTPSATATAKTTAKTTAKNTAKTTASATATSGTVTVDRVDVDFDKLQAVNDDIIGWLYLQDTIINYPLAQANSGRDANFYLSHAYDLTTNIAGTLYIDQTASAKFSNRNTFIHGHRMNNGSMFGKLNQYKSQSYFSKHPIMQLYTPSQNYYIYIFAVYEAEIDSFYSQTSFASSEEFGEYLQKCMDASIVTTGVTPSASDRIVSLCTCVVKKDTYRLVVQGVLVPMGDS